jgi:hypothetical protein
MINKDILVDASNGLATSEVGSLVRDSWMLVLSITLTVTLCGVFWWSTRGQVYETQTYVELMNGGHLISDRDNALAFVDISMLDEKTKQYLQKRKIDSVLVVNGAELIQHTKNAATGDIRYQIAVKGNSPTENKEVVRFLSEHVIDGLIYSYYVNEFIFQEELVSETLQEFDRQVFNKSTCPEHLSTDYVTLFYVVKNYLKNPARLNFLFKMRKKLAKGDFLRNLYVSDDLLREVSITQTALIAHLGKEQILKLIGYIEESSVFLNQTKSGGDVLKHLARVSPQTLEYIDIGRTYDLDKVVYERNAEFLKYFKNPSLFQVEENNEIKNLSLPLVFVIVSCLVFGFVLSLMTLFCLTWREQLSHRQ